MNVSSRKTSDNKTFGTTGAPDCTLHEKLTEALLRAELHGLPDEGGDGGRDGLAALCARGQEVRRRGGRRRLGHAVRIRRVGPLAHQGGSAAGREGRQLQHRLLCRSRPFLVGRLKQR